MVDETELDNALLQDISATLLQPKVSPAVYQPYASRDEALAVEEQVSTNIAESYCRVQRQLASPVVQQLNQLL